MLQKIKFLAFVAVMLGPTMVPVHAAEREDVRKVINLVTSVKMPYPESLRGTGPRPSVCGSSVPA